MTDFKYKTYAEKKEELDALTRQLQDGITNYIGSQRYTALLNSISRFHNYSTNNSIIISLQMPEASQVASFTTWKSLNRTINKGEHGLAIFCPIKYKTEKEVEKKDSNGEPVLDSFGKPILEKKLIEQTSFKIGHVFDISQTSQIKGKKEYPLSWTKDLQFEVDEFDCFMKAIRETSSVPIEIKKFNSHAKGYFSNPENKIVVQDGMSEAQTLKTSIHELAHSYLHNKKSVDCTKLTFCVAECMEFPNLGEYHDNLSLNEAIEIYKEIPVKRLNGIKGIGFELHDGSIYSDGMFPLIENDTIQVDLINTVKYYRESFEVQKAIMDARNYFQDDGYTLQSTKELQAESIAYIVCQHYGIDTSDYSFGYVTSWLEDEEQLMESLNSIKACSAEIIDKMDVSLKQSIQEKYAIYTHEEMAFQLDTYLQDLDLHEYRDQKISSRSICNETLQNIKEGNISHIEKFLKETISNNRDVKMAEKGKELLKCLKTFQKGDSLELLAQSRGRGIKR